MNVEEQVKNVNAECHPITDIDAIIIRWLNRGQKIVQSKKLFSSNSMIASLESR